MAAGFDDADDRRRARGREAERLLQEPLLKEVLDKLETTYVDVWKKAGSLEAREDAYRYFKLVEGLRSDLTSLAVTGQLAEKRQQQLAGTGRKWRL